MSEMCRMVGLVAAHPVETRTLLRDAPRSLWALSREHPDGWGVAIHDDDAWRVHRSTASAQTCSQFEAVVDAAHARVIIAHIRQKTVGATSLANTHPFVRGPLAFAHNGTITRIGQLVERSSPARLAEVQGETDSERLLAFVATRIDEATDSEAGLVAAVRELHAIPELGSANFLIPFGQRLYAHRPGRSPPVLTRHGTPRTASITIASEQLTDEHWDELPERSLWAVDSTAVRQLL